MVSFKYENGVVSSQGPMVDGKPEGYWKTFYPDGTLKSEGNRLNHELDSVWKFYSPEGIITQEITYKFGAKSGFRNTYHATGVLAKQESFLADVRIGTTKKFFLSGKLKETIPLDTLGKGREHGAGYEYAEEDGRVTAVVEYRNGFIAARNRINRKDKFNQKQGLWRYFRDDFSVSEEGRFKNDKKHGYWKTFDEEGNLLETLKYENGILIPNPEELVKLDIKREYHPNAQVKSVGSYSKGVKEGVHREYTLDGAVSAAKSALESHTRQLALELAPLGITANAIMAGVTDTPALRKIPGSTEMIDLAKRKNPSGRLTLPKDVADAIDSMFAGGRKLCQRGNSAIAAIGAADGPSDLPMERGRSKLDRGSPVS